MKDYSAMSDFEINKAVADIAMNGTWHLEPSHPNNKTGGWLYGSNGVQTYPMPDYCNNPADAWPIILSERISIEHDGDCWRSDLFNENGGYEAESDSPLRAAMTAYLMMKDAEKFDG